MTDGTTTRQRSSELIWQETQHQRLFRLLDALAGEVEVGAVLNELHHYAEEHFALEEAYMEVLAFPERASHCRAHEKFRAEIAAISVSKLADPAVRDLTAMFLREWLTRHIYGTDKVLEAFILESDLK